MIEVTEINRDAYNVLAMDLSLNSPALVVLRVEQSGIYFIDYLNIKNARVRSFDREKLSNIFYGVQEIYDRYEVKYIVREKGFDRYPRSTQQLYKVFGVVDLSLYFLGWKEPIYEIAPTTVKKYITGSGRASKKEVMDKVYSFVRLDKTEIDIDNDDISDAVAVGVTFINEYKIGVD